MEADPPLLHAQHVLADRGEVGAIGAVAVPAGVLQPVRAAEGGLGALHRGERADVVGGFHGADVVLVLNVGGAGEAVVAGDRGGGGHGQPGGYCGGCLLRGGGRGWSAGPATRLRTEPGPGAPPEPASTTTSLPWTVLVVSMMAVWVSSLPVDCGSASVGLKWIV